MRGGPAGTHSGYKSFFRLARRAHIIPFAKMLLNFSFFAMFETAPTNLIASRPRFVLPDVEPQAYTALFLLDKLLAQSVLTKIHWD